MKEQCLLEIFFLKRSKINQTCFESYFWLIELWIYFAFLLIKEWGSRKGKTFSLNFEFLIRVQRKLILMHEILNKIWNFSKSWSWNHLDVDARNFDLHVNVHKLGQDCGLSLFMETIAIFRKREVLGFVEPSYVWFGWWPDPTRIMLRGF